MSGGGGTLLFRFGGPEGLWGRRQVGVLSDGDQTCPSVLQALVDGWPSKTVENESKTCVGHWSPDTLDDIARRYLRRATSRNASGLNICSGTCEAFVAGAAVRCGSVGVGVLLAEVGGEIHEEAALLPLRGGLGVVLVEVLTRVRLAEKKNTCPLTTVSSPYMCEAFVAGFF